MNTTRNYLIYCSIYLLALNDCVMGLSLVVCQSLLNLYYLFSTNPVPPISYFSLRPHLCEIYFQNRGSKRTMCWVRALKV